MFYAKATSSFAKKPVPQAWAAFQEPLYGATVYYPTNWFSRQKFKNGMYEFTSLQDDKAVLYLKTEFDELRTGAAETVNRLKSGTGAHRIIDIQLGGNWYEMQLSPAPGFLQFTRVFYSCKERIVSAVSLIYPIKSADRYEKMLLKLKRRFSVGIGSKTPVRDCS